MTLEKLLQLKFSASELEALSDAELEKLLAPKFDVTRPDLSKWKEENKNKKVSMGTRTPKLKSSEELDREAKIKYAKAEVLRRFGLKL